MNVISSGENEVSCDAFKLTLFTYQSLPLASKYSLALSKLFANMFSLKFVFWSTNVDDGIFAICWVTPLPLLEPLKNTFT